MELLASPPDCQGLADVLRTELQVLYRTLRFSRDRQEIRRAAERLQLVLNNVEGVVANPQQRYVWSRDQQWGFVSLFAYVQEVKHELKIVARRYS
jgi:hypothetical protein